MSRDQETVPLSQSLGSGAVGHRQPPSLSKCTGAAAPTLKSLARNVLGRQQEQQLAAAERQEPSPLPLGHSTFRSMESQIIEWLDQHPAPSRAGLCAWCGQLESPDAVIVPFGTVPGAHAWLHSE